MSRRYYKLPPLTSLATFETAARHKSFKGAAEELGVTPGAVSHQIKFLETELGLSLFDRKHHGNNLTDHGESLFAVLLLMRMPLVSSVERKVFILTMLSNGRMISLVKLSQTISLRIQLKLKKSNRKIRS